MEYDTPVEFAAAPALNKQWVSPANVGPEIERMKFCNQIRASNRAPGLGLLLTG
jgi:hypothetical protein